MDALGVIPARGGSKSIPLKNIVPLCGKPLLAYTIEAALAAGCLSSLVVSTDHDKIAAVAEHYGASVIWRPEALATDEAPTEQALIHALETIAAERGDMPGMVLTLEPTSPFRTAGTIQRCVAMLADTGVDSVVGVVATHGCYGRIIDGRFEHLIPNQPRRRQDREALYKESSTIYGTRSNVLLAGKSVLGERPCPLIVEPEEAIDINTPLDLTIAEALMKPRKQDSDADG